MKFFLRLREGKSREVDLPRLLRVFAELADKFGESYVSDFQVRPEGIFFPWWGKTLTWDGDLVEGGGE